MTPESCRRCAHPLPDKAHVRGPKFRYCCRCQRFRGAERFRAWYWRHHAPAVA